LGGGDAMDWRLGYQSQLGAPWFVIFGAAFYPPPAFFWWWFSFEDSRPAALYFVVPPSDISRTKPLVRLILNQIGRRLTEELNANGRRHRVLLMLDEFPALGRLDFFESALTFMAGYGLVGTGTFGRVMMETANGPQLCYI
jgi:type IV secretory pathway TraG/TraD family ATPase VirD4